MPDDAAPQDSTRSPGADYERAILTSYETALKESGGAYDVLFAESIKQHIADSGYPVDGTTKRSATRLRPRNKRSAQVTRITQRIDRCVLELLSAGKTLTISEVAMKTKLSLKTVRRRFKDGATGLASQRLETKTLSAGVFIIAAKH